MLAQRFTTKMRQVFYIIIINKPKATAFSFILLHDLIISRVSKKSDFIFVLRETKECICLFFLFYQQHSLALKSFLLLIKLTSCYLLLFASHGISRDCYNTVYNSGV